VEIHVEPARAEDAAACEALLRSLPDWFGIEQAILDYRRDIETLETLIVREGTTLLGFLTLKHPFPESAEIQVMAVRTQAHGRGVGRALVHKAEGLLRDRGARFLQVKTLGEGRPDEHYARTRGFYRAMGFVPLEEHDLWGDTNPCLVFIKSLA
jgi:GNAT superfamily N-acetyltransferase